MLHELPLKAPDDLFTAPFRMQPGLRRQAAAGLHFTLLAPAHPIFAQKLAALRYHPAQCLLIAPSFDALPALRAVAHTLVSEHPSAFTLLDNQLHCRQFSATIDLNNGEVKCAVVIASNIFHTIKSVLNNIVLNLRAWALLSLCVEQDLAVPCAPDGTLGLLAVCLPSHWAPESKIGLPFAQIHAPVADNAMLLKAASGLVRLITAPADSLPAWERFVWTLTPSPAHDAHPLRHAGRHWPTASGRTLLERTFLRWERQSFIAVSGATCAQAVFTIHIHITPLLIAINRPPAVTSLYLSLQSMSAAVLQYRGLTEVQPALLTALAELTDGN